MCFSFFIKITIRHCWRDFCVTQRTSYHLLFFFFRKRIQTGKGRGMDGWYYEPSTGYSCTQCGPKLNQNPHEQVNSIKRLPCVYCGLHITQLQNYQPNMYTFKKSAIFFSSFEWICTGLFNALHQTLFAQAPFVSLHTE